MDKPITLKRKDFIVSITDVITNSNLPAFVMADVLKELYLQLSDLANEQEKIDFNNYTNRKETDNGNSETKRPD